MSRQEDLFLFAVGFTERSWIGKDKASSVIGQSHFPHEPHATVGLTSSSHSDRGLGLLRRTTNHTCQRETIKVKAK